MASAVFPCGWRDCRFSCSDCDVLKQHVTSHCNRDRHACLWSDCGFDLRPEAEEPEARFRRHLLSHCHLLELRSLGDRFRTAHRLPACKLELSVTQEIAAGFFQYRHRCEWDRCDFESDDVGAFWAHARSHLRRAPVERGFPWVCKWRECSVSLSKKNFANQSNLKTHLQKHTSEKAMACSACRRLFAAAENFHDHLLKQNESAMRALQGAFRCKLCPLTFARRRLLGTHVRTVHRPSEVCGACERHFCSPSALQRHQATVHPPATGADIRLERCPLCPAEFRSRQGLLEHARAKHHDYVYRCTACAFETSYYSTLWTHVFTEHEQRRHACHECGLLLDDPKAFRKHLKGHGLQPDKGFKKFRFRCSEANLVQLMTEGDRKEADAVEEG